MIDYTYKPKTFANTAVIGYSYFEMLYDLLNYAIPVSPESIIGLSIFSEAVVLHEELVPNNVTLNVSSQDEADFLQLFLDKEVLYYEKINDIFFPLPNSAAECIHNKMSDFTNGTSMSSKILFRTGQKHSVDEQLNIVQFGYSEENMEALSKYYKQWEKLIDLVGIPEIHGIYDAMFGHVNYNFDYLNRSLINPIPKELLDLIDSKRFLYAEQIRSHIGNTYVALPSIITIVLNRSKSPEDIPHQILLLRDEIANFRNQCTKYEYELRCEDNFLAQCEIIDEINNVYNCFNFDGNVRKKRRILKECADIIGTSPTSLAANVSKKSINHIDEALLKLKVPGFYDLYKKSFDVTDNLRTLKRLFGNAIDDKFINQLNLLVKQSI